MADLTGRVVVVTGASMGIGEAIAKKFVDTGASVVLSSRDLDRAEAARARIGYSDRTMAVACDVRVRKQNFDLAQAAMERFRRIDVWVNNAGHGLLDSMAEVEDGALREMFDTNLFGAVAGMQAAIAVMKTQSRGTIINISSVAGHIPLPFHAGYSATKFAMNAIGKAANVELKRNAIRVLTVCPGYVRTAFSDNVALGTERKRVRPGNVKGIDAERVARATLRGYLGNKREVIVPWTMHIPVKVYQIVPRVVEWAMGRMAG